MPGPGEVTLMDAGPADDDVVPGDEEPVPEALGHVMEFGLWGGQALIVVLHHPDGDDQLQPVDYGPVVVQGAAQLDAPLEHCPAALVVSMHPGRDQAVGVEGPTERGLVPDLLRHDQDIRGVALQRFEVAAVQGDVGGAPQRTGAQGGRGARRGRGPGRTTVLLRRGGSATRRRA